MQTDLLATSTAKERANAVAQTVALLRKGAIVALPTETVYGLATDALNPIAVAKIFEAKDRPRFDPLIVHLPSRDWLGKIVDLPGQDRRLASWPDHRRAIVRICQDRSRHSSKTSLRAGTIPLALRAEDAAAFDRQRRIIFAGKESACGITGLGSAANWRPLLLEVCC